MVRHDFMCLSCGHIFEKLVDVNNLEDQKCEICQNPARLVFTKPHGVNTKPWEGMQKLMRADARGEIEIAEKDYPYDYNRYKHIYK